MRHHLSTEPRFRALIAEVARDLRGRGDSHLSVRFHGERHAWRVPLEAEAFTFEDHGANAGVDCRVCATRRDRRFALFVECDDGVTRGPVGSGCLFEHVLGERGRELARKLDDIARDALHNAEHAHLLTRAGSRVAYLEQLGVSWTWEHRLLEASGLPLTRVRELLTWRASTGHLPRALYRALADATTRALRADDARAPRPTAPSSSGAPAPRLAHPDLGLSSRAQRLGQKRARGREEPSEVLEARHLQLLREHLPSIDARLPSDARERILPLLRHGRVPTRDVPLLVGLLRQAMELAGTLPPGERHLSAGVMGERHLADLVTGALEHPTRPPTARHADGHRLTTHAGPLEGHAGSVRREAWPRARVYVPAEWTAHADAYIAGGPPSSKEAEARHQALLALELLSAAEAEIGRPTPLTRLDEDSHRSILRHYAWEVAWEHGLDGHYTEIQRHPLAYRLRRRRETPEVSRSLTRCYGSWFHRIREHHAERLDFLFTENVRRVCHHYEAAGTPVAYPDDLPPDQLVLALPGEFAHFAERGSLQFRFCRRLREREQRMQATRR